MSEIATARFPMDALDGGPRAPRTPPILRAGIDRHQLLAVLTRLKRGDFVGPVSTRACPGIDGRIADAFNEVVELNERMADELERLEPVVGKEGRIAQRAALGDDQGSWAASRRVGQHPDRRPRPAHDRDGPRHRRGRQGRPVADDGSRDRRPAAAGRVPAHGADDQHDGATSSARSRPR